MKNFDKDNTSGINHEGVKPNMPLKYLTASSIIGDPVTNTNGDHMGVIKDLMIDLNRGTISYFIIELGGFLGIGERFFAFPYALLKVEPVTRTFILNQEMKKLKEAPGFDKEHWPNTNSHEFETSGNYWGGFMGPHTAGAY